MDIGNNHKCIKSAITLFYCRFNTTFVCLKLRLAVMPTCESLILEFSSRTRVFGMTELWDWISAVAHYSRNTVSCLLYRLVAVGDIIRIAKGLYTKAENRTVFEVIPTDEEAALVKGIKKKFPFAPLVVYNGGVLSRLQHHLSSNNMTYIETDRSAVEPVFNYLRKEIDNVWLAPDAELVYRYIDLAKGGIIVKPLVTEAPVKNVHGIDTPTLEKILVDIRKDADFSYLHGTEAERMYENANSLYAINKSRLNRYARRRGITI